MRSKSVDEIIAKAGCFLNGAVRSVHGTILPAQMQALMAEGKFHKVPILMGNNADKWTWFTSLTELDTKKPMTGRIILKRSLDQLRQDRQSERQGPASRLPCCAAAPGQRSPAPRGGTALRGSASAYGEFFSQRFLLEANSRRIFARGGRRKPYPENLRRCIAKVGPTTKQLERSRGGRAHYHGPARAG